MTADVICGLAQNFYAGKVCRGISPLEVDLGVARKRGKTGHVCRRCAIRRGRDFFEFIAVAGTAKDENAQNGNGYKSGPNSVCLKFFLVH